MVALPVGLWELARALATAASRCPVAPVVAGGTVMLVGAYWGGMERASVALALTCIGTLVWRLADGAEGFVRDSTAGVVRARLPHRSWARSSC